MSVSGLVVAVTGARGAIGHVVTRALEHAGARVIAIDVLAGDKEISAQKSVRADVLDLDAITAAFDGADACVHLAGAKASRVGAEESYACTQANVVGTINVMEACRRARVKRVVFASTAHVYGFGQDGPVLVTAPLAPASVYAGSKVAAEHVVSSVAIACDISHAIVRLANVYGASTERETVVGRALDQASRGGPIALFSHDAVRDFIHVDDVASAIVLLTGARDNRGAFNVGSGVGVTTGDLAHRIGAAASKLHGREVTVAPPRASEPSGTLSLVLSITATTDAVGFSPRVSLDAGLSRALELYVGAPAARARPEDAS